MICIECRPAAATLSRWIPTEIYRLGFKLKQEGSVAVGRILRSLYLDLLFGAEPQFRPLPRMFHCQMH